MLGHPVNPSEINADFTHSHEMDAYEDCLAF